MGVFACQEIKCVTCKVHSHTKTVYWNVNGKTVVFEEMVTSELRSKSQVCMPKPISYLVTASFKMWVFDAMLHSEPTYLWGQLN